MEALGPLVRRLQSERAATRRQALQSVVFKLRFDLLSMADLVQHTPLLVALLEWFNFREIVDAREALALLQRFAEVSAPWRGVGRGRRGGGTDRRRVKRSRNAHGQKQDQNFREVVCVCVFKKNSQHEVLYCGKCLHIL